MTLQLVERPPQGATARLRSGGALVIPALFAAEEIAWLAEEAKLLSWRLSGRPRQAAGATLRDIDVHEEPFRRLASHPRLIEQARRVLGEPFGILGTLLADGAAAEVAVPPGLTVAVQLSGEGRGTVTLLQDGLVADLPSADELMCLIGYVPSARATRRLEPGLSDDCLWPPAFACAG